MPSGGEKLTLTEELFGTFTKVSRWATSGELTADPGTSQRRGCAHPLSVVKVLVFLLLLVLFPLFVLPMFLARLAQVGRGGFRHGATVDVTSGEQARWSHDMMQPVADADQIAAGTAAIASHDPGFRASVLTNWAAGATALIGQSVVSGDATATRTFMADGLYRTHQALLELLARAGISCAGSWRAVDAALVEASRSPLVDEARIRVTCQGWRWERHGPTGVTLRGGPDPATWSEDMTFARSADATTPPVGGLPASRCPSCGADLDLDPDGACRYCKGIVTTGRQDWVMVSWQRDPW